MFEPHYDICVECKKDDVLIVVKAGYCGPCNYKFKQAKKKKEGKKTGGWKYERKPTGEMNVFEAVLERMPDVETRCFVCDIRVPVVTHVNMAHVLAKGRYPKFRLNPENIRILCGNCHYSYDMKPHSELKSEGWERLFKLQDELKEEYKTLTDL